MTQIQENTIQNSTLQLPISQEKLGKLSKAYKSLDNDLYAALNFFLEGKFSVASELSKQIETDLKIISNIFNEDAQINMQQSKDYLLSQLSQLKPLLASSKLYAIFKFSCNTKDLLIDVSKNTPLINNVINALPAQLNLTPQSFESFKNIYEDFLGLLNSSEISEVCDEFDNFPNHYDSNFENLQNNLSGAIKALLNPIELFEI